MAREPVVDIHAHFVPEGYLRLMEAEGRTHGVTLRPPSLWGEVSARTEKGRYVDYPPPEARRGVRRRRVAPMG